MLHNAGTLMCQRMRVESDSRERAIVALWRLVQWQRMRLERVERDRRNECVNECSAAADARTYALEACDALALLSDADAAVLEARVSEENNRIDARDRLRQGFDLGHIGGVGAARTLLFEADEVVREARVSEERTRVENAALRWWVRLCGATLARVDHPLSSYDKVPMVIPTEQWAANVLTMRGRVISAEGQSPEEAVVKLYRRVANA